MEFKSLARRVGDGKAPQKEGSAFTRQPSAPVATPRYGQTEVAAPTETHAIDRDRYECVQTLEDLDRWIARARAAGVVGFDTETDALSSTHAG
ncbi:hypothetical protein, partial [Klebsiella variicola]